MNGKYRRGVNNMRAVLTNLDRMATELERDLKD